MAMTDLVTLERDKSEMLKETLVITPGDTVEFEFYPLSSMDLSFSFMWRITKPVGSMNWIHDTIPLTAVLGLPGNPDEQQWRAIINFANRKWTEMITVELLPPELAWLKTVNKIMVKKLIGPTWEDNVVGYGEVEPKEEEQTDGGNTPSSSQD